MRYFRFCLLILGALVLCSLPVGCSGVNRCPTNGELLVGARRDQSGQSQHAFRSSSVAKPGRGMPFTYTLSFDSSVWSPVTVSGVKELAACRELELARGD